jgi:hypothetical protein
MLSKDERSAPHEQFVYFYAMRIRLTPARSASKGNFFACAAG